MATIALHEFIAGNRDDIIRRCRVKVATRSAPTPTTAELEYGVPVFLDQLVRVLRFGDGTNPEIAGTALLHGNELLQQGFTVSQVVHDYGDVCQSVTELAEETGASISTTDFHTLNRCLDEAIAGAVTEYGRARSQSDVDGEIANGNERLGFLAHELRNLINTAMLAFHVLKTGNVGVQGSTGAVLDRSLAGLTTLITRSLTEVRLTHAVHNREPIRLAGLIDEVASSANLDAAAKGITFTVVPVEDGVAVEADRPLLAAVVVNLLQNAFKFTRPGTTVTLRVGASAERVLIAIQDECGGLPGGDPSELFRAFEQRGADRSGLGLGLAFSRWAVEANSGRIYARSLPGQGCIFTIDLPRLPVSALAVR